MKTAKIDVDASRRPSAPTQTLGVGGTVVYGGYVHEIETDQTLVGQARWKRYSNILVNTSIVGAGVRFYLNLVAKAGWTFEPADESPEAEELAEKVTKALTENLRAPWHRVVRRASMYKFWGFSVQEWIGRRSPTGEIDFFSIEPRPQPTIEKWDLDDSGFVKGIVQQSPQDFTEIYLPRNRLLYMCDDSLSDDPRGIGLLRHCANPAKELARFEQLEGFGFEVDLRGIPVGRAPFSQLREMQENGELTEAQRLAIEKPLTDFITAHIKSPQMGLLLDSMVYQDDDEAQRPSATPQWDMKLLQGGSQGHEAIAAAIERKNREIARIMGVEGLLLGDRSAGSFALSKDKSNNFALLIDSALTELRATVRSDLIQPLFMMNGWNQDLMPKPKTDPAQYQDMDEVTGALENMSRAGAILAPNDPVINEVRDLLGLSKAPEVDVSLILPEEPTNAPVTETPDPDDG